MPCTIFNSFPPPQQEKRKKEKKKKKSEGKKSKFAAGGKKKETTNKSREMGNVSLGKTLFGPLFVQKRNDEMAPVCHNPSPERWGMTKFLADGLLPAGRILEEEKKKTDWCLTYVIWYVKKARMIYFSSLTLFVHCAWQGRKRKSKVFRERKRYIAGPEPLPWAARPDSSNKELIIYSKRGRRGSHGGGKRNPASSCWGGVKKSTTSSCQRERPICSASVQFQCCEGWRNSSARILLCEF